MLSCDPRPGFGRLAGAVVALALGLSAGGCFTPLYAERAAGPGQPGVREALSQVEVRKVEGRIGHELRNALIFELAGGAGAVSGAPFQLEITVRETVQSTSVDPVSGLAIIEVVSLDAFYKLRDAEKAKVVVDEQAFAKISIERVAQRFARDRAVRDAQNRAAKVLAEQIKSRLASFFLTRA